MNQYASLIRTVGDGEAKKFQCEIHPDCQLEVLNLSKNNTQKSRFLCIKCIIQVYEQSKGLPVPILHIQDLLNDPNAIIQNLLQKANNQEVNGAQSIIELMDKQFTQFENMIKGQLLNMRQKVLQVKLACSQVSCEILNYLRINDFVKQIQIVRGLDTHQGTKEFQQLEELSNFISANIDQSHQHINQRILESQNQIIQNLQKQIKKLGEDSQEFFKAQIENIKQLVKDYVQPEICAELKDFPQINEMISDGRFVEYQLIYQGTKHGLNGKGYWNQCDSQHNLLTIFVSQNGNIFGGYSPCQIFRSQNTHKQDRALKSFLFLYNKRQIFKLKQSCSHLAVFCNSVKGPTFGQFDLEIESDFSKGSSNLGICYDISNQNIADPRTHLFGDVKPQIIECKVYKVIFK